jgi:hypothetical protein
MFGLVAVGAATATAANMAERRSNWRDRFIKIVKETTRETAISCDPLPEGDTDDPVRFAKPDFRAEFSEW